MLMVVFVMLFGVFVNFFCSTSLPEASIRPKLKKLFVCPLPTQHFSLGRVDREIIIFLHSVESGQLPLMKDF